MLGLLRGLVDPAIAMLCLLGLSLLFRGGVGTRELVLGVIVFSLGYPGQIPFGHRPAGLLRQVFGNWAVLCGIMLTFGLLTGVLRAFDQTMLGTWVIATPVLQATVHWLAPWVVPRILAFSEPQSAIIVGANSLGRTLARSLISNRLSQVRVTAFFDDRSPERLGSALEVPLTGNIDAVADFVRANRVDQIYIALPMASQPRILKLLDRLRDTTASIYFLPDIFMFDLIQARMDIVAGLPIVAVCETPFHGTTGVIKRMSDVLVSGAALKIGRAHV